MRKKFIASIACYTAILFAFPACEKEDNNPPEKTKTELISQSTWKFSTAFAGSTDVTANVHACLKDNIVTFNANGTGNVNESTNVCSPSYAGNFTWSFQSNETVLFMSAPLFPGGSGTFNLVSLTETNLVVSQDMTIPPYPTTNVKVTFIH